MSNTEPSSIDRPPRQLSSLPLGLRLLGLDLKRQARTRKVFILFGIQLLPALIALLSLIWGDSGGLSVFRGTVTSVYLPLLLPLAALFFGGPTIVDEVEDRTITYLMLRPISRPTLYLSKLATSIILAMAITILPILVLFGVCIIGAPGEFGEALPVLGSTLATVGVGAIAYTALFALLGVIFASTLLPGIVYYIVFELILATIPIVEILSVKFHLYALGGFDRRDPTDGESLRERLETMLLDQPLEFEWWASLAVLSLFTAGTVLLATIIFRNRQFHV